MTTLGILDAVPPKYYNYEGVIKDPEYFERLLRRVGLDVEIVVYHVAAGVFPPSIRACDLYLITGSPAAAYDPDEWIAQLKQFVRDLHAAQIPLVGVCFGHQLIAEALGGRVTEAEVGWQAGLYPFQLLAQPAWMHTAPPTVKVYHMNKDQVIQLPPQATHLATSDVCPNVMYTVGGHILAIQGHPEMPAQELHRYMAELGDTLPAEVVQYAQSSVAADTPDDDMIGLWLRRFYEGHMQQ